MAIAGRGAVGAAGSGEACDEAESFTGLAIGFDRQRPRQANLPTGLDSEHQKMLDELKTKDGRDFDVAYDQLQLKAHQDAVALFESYAKAGDNPDLKKWAAKTLPHLKQHLAMAQNPK
jgi:predicted outer membrane protein